jgi:hypothetical protein
MWDSAHLAGVAKKGTMSKAKAMDTTANPMKWNIDNTLILELD